MERTEEEWMIVARYVRYAVNKVASRPRPLCLPGEPQACGQDARQHVMLWAADLKAAAHLLIEDSAGSHDERIYYTGQYFRDKLAAVALRGRTPREA